MNRIGQLRWVLLLGLLAAAVGGCGTGSQWVKVSDQQDFKNRISTASQPVLVEFYQDACPHCWWVGPGLNGVANDYSGRVMFLKVEPGQGGALFGQYNIQGTPTVLLFTGGMERQRWVGEGGTEGYRQALDQALGAQRRGR